MSGLLTGLSVLGGVVLIGVIGYNEWLQKKATMRTAEGEGLRRDPAETSAPPPAAAAEMVLPIAAGVASAAQPIDALIDSIITLDFPLPHYGEALLAAMPATRRIGSKSLLVEGLSTESGLWESPQAGRQYSQAQMAIQLANRSGALNEVEFSEFVSKANTYAGFIDAYVAAPDMGEEVARARELDEFASRLDTRLELRILAHEASWSAGYVQQHAQRLGFSLGLYPGRMVYADLRAEPAQPLVVLKFDAHAALAEDLSDSAVRDLTLELDVSHVPREAKAYDLMRELAIQLAASMGGKIVDGAGQVITEATMNAIDEQLQHIYDQLDARDLSAGSALARRLFA